MENVSDQHRPGRIRRTAALTGFAFLSLLALFVAAVSTRYLLPQPIAPAPPMLPHIAQWSWAVIIHIGGGVAALTLAPFQLVTRRGPRRLWHRWAGRLYVLSCFISGAAGLWLALFSTAGPIASLGFGLLALTWIATTGLGWRRAVQRRFLEHRRWMIRSLALTCAAISLRILVPLSPLAGLPFDDAYRAIAFLCWIPNLLLAELWIRLSRPLAA